jgi:transcriptional regulator with XRE-family HTH domain
MPALPFCKVELKAPKLLSCHYPCELTSLGDHLRKKRLDLKLLQKDVAEILGADDLWIVNWEKNRIEPLLEFLAIIVDFPEYVPLSILPK